MSTDQTAQFRADHDLTGDDSVRERVADTLHTELVGLGAEQGWWGRVSVH